jgi:hypothetical protein
MSLSAKTCYISAFLGILLLALSISAQKDKKLPDTNRVVENNTIISDKLPKINVVVSDDFKYVGRFPFTIRDVAGGERFVFVDAAKDGKVERMFIAQFEGFFSHIDNYYKYSFENAETFGSHKFRHNTWAYSNKSSRAENPNNEGVLTEDFLKKKGYILEDELMMSRFLTVPEEDKKHELILYYLENVSKTKQNIADFYKDDKENEVWKEISRGLKERSLKSFEIK